MKINLVQLDAGTAWARPDLSRWLAQVPPADLTVFPECFPFGDGAKTISDAAAVQHLEEVAQKHPGVTFIAGGYVQEASGGGARIRRNRVYLVHQGFVVDSYDKRVRYKAERFTAGRVVKVFAWGAHRCVPLICADADQGPDSDFMTDLVERALAAGAGAKVPLVVSSYGGMLTQPYWTESLYHLADACGAPVAICGIAGESKARFRYEAEYGGDDLLHPYGGGGSDLYLPGRVKAAGIHVAPGIVRVDTSRGTSVFRPF